MALSRRHGCSPVPPANSAHSDKPRVNQRGVEPVTPCLQSGERASWSIVGANKLRIGVLGTARSRIYCCSFLLQVRWLLATVPRFPVALAACPGVFSPPDHVAMWMSCAVQTFSSTLMRKIPQVERTPLAGKCRPPGRTWPTTPGANSMSRTRLPIEACHGRASHWWHPQCWHHSDE